jgi:hypothetical protein
MEPRLNIKISQIFEAAEGNEGYADPNFIQPGEQWVGDYLNETSDYERNMRAYLEQREGIGAHLDQNVQNMGFSQTPNPAQDRALMVMEPEVAGTPDLAEMNMPAQLQRAARKIQKQAGGFNTTQPHPDFTMGVVANINRGTLVESRVVVETPSTKIAGTVLAVGDSEFAVVWDDRTASVERKADYELVFAE